MANHPGLAQKSPTETLAQRILDYHKLKDDWGMGHIKCTLLPCDNPGCPGKRDNLKAGLKNKHMVVTAHYTNFFENETYVEFLGFSIKDAYNRLPHVKNRTWFSNGEV